MARRRAQAVKRGRPTHRGRGSRGPSRGRHMSRGPSRGRHMSKGRSRRRAQAVKRPTSPQGPSKVQGPQKPQGRLSSGALSSMRDVLRKQKEIGGAIRGGPQSRATSRPKINPGQELKKFMDTMPRAPQGPRGPQGPQGPMRAQQDRNFAVPQRPIPNRDGRMAQMQADINRANMAAMANARQRPPSISMDPSKGTFGKGMQQSNYMRQQMSPQQSQNAMGRGPMPRANIGSVQTPQLNFNKQINQSPRGRRGRVIPRRR